MRRVVIWDGAELVPLDVVDEVLDPSPARRIAYRLANGYWTHGIRGKSRPDEVRELTEPLANTPDWVRVLRGQALRGATGSQTRPAYNARRKRDE
jgi:hypothetical protein